jgi:adenosylhomocysteine nucleosidase
MKVGIIGAMEQEVSILKDQINGLHTLELAGCTIYTGTINDVEVVLLQSGIGKVAAAIGASIMLDTYKPDMILNTGSAGGFDSSLNVGDVVISTEVRYHDADVTAFGYEMGQMAQMPAAFISDEKLISVAEKAIAMDPETPNTIKGLICTGDTFVNTEAHRTFIDKYFPNAIAVEMEAAAIAQVCHQYKVPFVVVRAISDVADKESPMSFDEFLPLAAQHSSKMVINMLDLLQA